jgi:hypothetical protein
MYEVFHTDGKYFPSLSDFYRTREEAENHVARATGCKSVNGVMVDMVGSDFLAIREVERESKPCKFCGGEVQSNAVDFCRSCFYGGEVFKEGVSGIIDALKAHPMIDAESVGVWHTGGGCFAVGANIDGDDSLALYCSDEASVDTPPSAENPWMIGLQWDADDGDCYLDGGTFTDTASAVQAFDALLARWDAGERD